MRSAAEEETHHSGVGIHQSSLLSWSKGKLAQGGGKGFALRQHAEFSENIRDFFSLRKDSWNQKRETNQVMSFQRTFSDDLAREKRARLRAERLYEQVQRELLAANERLKAHAFSLSHQVIAQREELSAVRSLAEALKGQHSQVSEDLHAAHSRAELANTRLREAVETLIDGFAVFDANEVLILANPAYLDLFHAFPEVRLGIRYQRMIEICAYEDLVSLEDWSPDDWVEMMMSRWTAAAIDPVDLHFTHGRSVRLVDRRAENGDFVSLANDITKMLEYQTELIEAQKRAEAAAEAKSAFLANMSHEIRTPMNGMVGMAQLLVETDLNDEQRNYAETISKSGESLVTIINDILDFSNMDAGRLELRPEIIDLEKTIHDVMIMLAPAARDKRVELILDYDLFLADPLKADQGRLRQVLTNLVGNAIKFTDSGYVLVRAIGVGNTAHGHMINITVEDTGIGISKANQDRIFTEFSQVEEMANRRFEGTGLGLAITRQIVAAMGGQIWVESEEGIGSCFGISLELQSEPDASARDIVRLDPSIRSVLIISDHLISREIIARRLQATGVNTLTATQIDASVRQIAKSRPDRVLLDQDLSAAAADVVLSGLAEHVPGTPVVMMCSNLLSAQSLRREKRIAAALPKPMLWRDLVCALGAPEHDSATCAQAGTPAASRPEAQHEVLRVLYAEDNRTNQLVFSKMLKGLKLDLTLAENGRQAVARFQELRPDVIFMDISMPEMDGREATQAIRALPGGAHVPIIACTAHALRDEIDRIMAVGVNAVLTKPLSKAELIKALQDHAPAGSDLTSP
ncbi:MAG: response regulator [Rhodobacteraceae bacterium]|nr:MAG: response regulator [Paracoccaceae bacterium]